MTVAPNGVAGTIVSDGPSRMVKRPTGSDGEPSSPNCESSAGVKARHPTAYALVSNNNLALSGDGDGDGDGDFRICVTILCHILCHFLSP